MISVVELVKQVSLVSKVPFPIYMSLQRVKLQQRKDYSHRGFYVLELSRGEQFVQEGTG